MNLGDMKWEGVTIKNVPEPQRSGLKEWRANVLTRQGRQGLWISTEVRGYGSSYAAQAITGRLHFFDNTTDGKLDVHHVEATDLIRSLRKTWTGNSQVRAHADDLGLWQETQRTEDSIEFYFYEAPVLWIDDLHHKTIDWQLWRKNFQPLVERRAKHDMPTVICSTLAPDGPLVASTVIMENFVPVFFDEPQKPGAFVAPKVSSDVLAERVVKKASRGAR